MSNEEDNILDNIPSIIIEGDFSKKTASDNAGSTIYQINGENFVDYERDDKVYQSFEVYSQNPDNEEIMEGAVALNIMDISLTPVPYGYIVNNTVYLTEHQWHTISISGVLTITELQCAVCDYKMAIQDVNTHLKADSHKVKLDLYKPLAEYDLSITRKINTKYHCGVCNQEFLEKNKEDHYNSKIHESQLLFAMNKAMDIMYDSNTQGVKKDVYHYNEHNISDSNNNSSEEKFSEASNNYFSCEEHHSDENGAVSVSDRWRASGEKLGANNDISKANKDKFWETNTNALSFKHYNFYTSPNDFRNIDYFKGTDVGIGKVSMEGQNLYKLVKDFDYPKPAFIDNEASPFCDDEFYDLEALNSTNSYANKAKKPKEEHDEIIEIDLGEKSVQVKYDSYHMIIYIKPNFYCMACKLSEHIKLRLEHCKNVQHIMNLARCNIVREYEDHFIRQIDEKLYHCGHCNKLLFIDLMGDHIETVHPKKNLDNKTKRSSSVCNKKKDLSCTSTPVKCRSRTDSRCSDFDEKCLTTKPKLESSGFGSNHNVSKPNETIYSVKYNNNNNDNGNDDVVMHNNNNNKYNHNDVSQLNNNNNNKQQFKINTNSTQNSVQPKQMDINENSLTMKNNENLQPYSNLSDLITIMPFDCKLTISKLSLHIICDKKESFYCALCDVTCVKDVLKIHSDDHRHLAKLYNTPFILPFGNNLIRAIREALHCAICNCPVRALDIYKHIDDPQHKTLLQVALNPVITRLPYNEDRLHKDNDDNVINNDNDDNVNNINNSDADDDDNEDNGNLECTFNTSEDIMFDFEEYVYLKLKNNFVRVSASSYHSLVSTGDVARYCFVCSSRVELDSVLRHVESRAHVESLEQCAFLERREGNLLRQSYLLYHCGVCNLLVYERDLKSHLEWPPHLEQRELCNRNVRKERRLEIKGGAKEIVVNVKKEIIYLHDDAPRPTVKISIVAEKHKVLLKKYENETSSINKAKTKNPPKNIDSPTKNNNSNMISYQKSVINDGVLISSENTMVNDKKTDIKKSVSPISEMLSAKSTMISSNSSLISNKKANDDKEKKSKMIINNSTVYVVPWENWNAIAAFKNCYKCLICQKELKMADIDAHCGSEWHSYALDKPIEKQYELTLVRKITEQKLNCLICNTELVNQTDRIKEHINGKKHVKNYDVIIKESAETDRYEGCNEDIVMI